MQVGEGTFYRNLADLFAPLRMPLFTFLSGFVYAYFPVMTGRVAPFATKKLRRLGLPLLTLTTIYYLADVRRGRRERQGPSRRGLEDLCFPLCAFVVSSGHRPDFCAAGRAGASRRAGDLPALRRDARLCRRCGRRHRRSCLRIVVQLRERHLSVAVFSARPRRESLSRGFAATGRGVGMRSRFRDSCGFSLCLGATSSAPSRPRSLCWSSVSAGCWR